ncbi:MAG: manganese-dependent inorganic pyrophosphatase, partial [Rhodobacteraceae bacterium]
MIKVFGHKAPDTDATGSAIIWAWYLTAQGTAATPYVLGTPNTEAAFVLERWGYETPALLEDVSADDKVVIVDTNNPAELPEHVNDAEIIEIIDHHLLVGGIKTKQPINITIKPLACCATIMAGMMGADLATAPREIKGLILSCILSDTLEFRSPTTTQIDIDMAKELA